MNTKSREVQLNRTKELVHTEKKEKKGISSTFMRPESWHNKSLTTTTPQSFA